LTLTGTNLTGPDVAVIFDGNPTAPQAPQATGPAGSQVTASVPVLPAGITTLRIVQRVPIGAPPAKNFAESNVSLFYLQPVIRQGPDPDDDLITAGPGGTGGTPPAPPAPGRPPPAPRR